MGKIRIVGRFSVLLRKEYFLELNISVSTDNDG